MIKILLHAFAFVFLTAISQVGGLVWLIALCFLYRALVFFSIYTTVSIVTLWIAPYFGREPLPCLSGDTLKMQSVIYCVLNRQYVVPALKDALVDYATKMEIDFPLTTTLVLDANFPFISGFPLLPHLSHNDGRKVDLAFYYKGDAGYLPDATKSPIGYFAFEDGPTNCPDNSLTLRWNMNWLQGYWPNYQLPTRTFTNESCIKIAQQ